MSKASILSIVARIAGRDPGELEPGMNLTADLGLDSPKALELLVSLEDDLGIYIEDEEAARLETVGDLLEAAAVGV